MGGIAHALCVGQSDISGPWSFVLVSFLSNVFRRKNNSVETARFSEIAWNFPKWLFLLMKIIDGPEPFAAGHLWCKRHNRNAVYFVCIWRGSLKIKKLSLRSSTFRSFTCVWISRCKVSSFNFSPWENKSMTDWWRLFAPRLQRRTANDDNKQ